MKAKFEIGKTYTTRSACDYDCVYRFKVVKRTEKTVSIRCFDRVLTRRIYISYHGDEAINPLGSYSMSPVVTAADAEVREAS
jgi:hypothetical protein